MEKASPGFASGPLRRRRARAIRPSESRRKQAPGDLNITWQTIRMGERSHLRLAHCCAAATQAAGDDRDKIARAQMPLFKTPRKGHDVPGAEGVFEFGKGAKRQTKPKPAPAEYGFNFAAMKIRHGRLRSP